MKFEIFIESMLIRLICLRFNDKYPDWCFSKQYIIFERVFFQVYDTRVSDSFSLLLVSAVCDQNVVKQAVECCTGERNLEIPLDIVREKCTWRFYILDSFLRCTNTCVGVFHGIENFVNGFSNLFSSVFKG